MANKKTKNQIDSLRGDVAALTEAIWALREQVTVEVAAAAAGASATRGQGGSNGPTRQAADHLEAGRPTFDLVALDDDAAAQLLNALGHRQRLAIVRMLIEGSASAAELVEQLNLGTTGAAYHHLNVLLAADLVVQQSRGVYEVDGGRVSGLLTLLSGVAATLDPAPSPDQRPFEATDDALLAQTSSI